MENGNHTNTQTGHWQPFHPGQLQGMMNALTRKPTTIRVATTERAAPAVPTDIYETADHVVIVMDVPGREASAFEVRLEKNVLLVQCPPDQRADDGRTYHLLERGRSACERAFTLPSTVDPDRVEARYDAGVLTITLTKREEAKPRRIEVTSS